MKKSNFLRLPILAILFVLGLITIISCSKSKNANEIETITNLDVNKYVTQVEQFHRLNIEESFHELKSNWNYELVCQNTLNRAKKAFPEHINSDDLDNLLKREAYFSNPIEMLNKIDCSKKDGNEFLNAELIKTISIELMNLADNYSPAEGSSIETITNDLRILMLNHLSEHDLKPVDEFTIKAEIEVFISSAKSWLNILSDHQKSWFSRAWKEVKGYATADALGGVASVMMDSEIIIGVGILTGGSAALAVGAASFGKGALVGSLIYGLAKIV